ncbi:PhageMetallopep domain-containing protein [Gammaproteobacteria bacterium]
MAKFDEPFEDTQALYDEKIKAVGLDQFINITVVVNNTAKELFKVNKANDLLKYRTGDDVLIVLNEKIFEQLTDAQKHIVVEDSLASIHFDTEKDRLIITKPDVIAYSGVLSKFTFETWNVVRESIKTLYAAEKSEA